MIAGIALAAVPRSPLSGGPGEARAAIAAAADSAAVRVDSVAAPADTATVRPDSTGLPAGPRVDATAAPRDTTAAARVDTTAAPRDTTAAARDTTSAGTFASEPPETLRFIPPPGLEPPTNPPTASATPPSVQPARPGEPAKPYGPLPKGVAAPGEPPKERAGIWGLHPAAIIAALVVVHVLVIRLVTR